MLYNIIFVTLVIALPYVTCWVNNGNSSAFLEGDIIKNSPTTSDNPHERNAATIFERHLWQNGIVYYIISSDFSDQQKNVIKNMMIKFQSSTCVTFQHRVNEPDYIEIIKNSFYCASSVGRKGGWQTLLLTDHCLAEENTVLHELMHALGFFHEHNRPDRDDYIELFEDNIIEDHNKNFVKQSASNATVSYTGYDFKSVMHYPKNAFSKNGRDTIKPKPQYDTVIIQANGLSDLDKLEINCVYKCPGYESCSVQRDSSPYEEDYSTCDYTLMAGRKARKLFSEQYFGSEYRNDIDCTWTITAPSSNRIVLIFQHFHLEESPNCGHDRLTVYYEDKKNPDSLKEVLCGIKVRNFKIESIDNKLYIHFYTDSFTVASGFRIVYKAKESDYETYVIADHRLRYFTSHAKFGEENYKANTSYKWTIRALNGERVVLVVDEFHLQSSADCSLADFRAIYDGARQIGKYCGAEDNISNLPPYWTSTGDTFNLHFRTDASVGAKGFKLLYYSTGSHTCDHNLVATEEMKSIPDAFFATLNDKRDLLCNWFIQGSQSRTIIVKIDLGNGTNCLHEKLDVFYFDSPSDQRRVKKLVCGNNRWHNFHSWNTVHIRVRKHNTALAPHVKIYYSFELDQNFTADDTPRYIYSHADYGHENYKPNFHATFTIQASHGNHVVLVIDEFQIENLTNCTHDFLSVYDGFPNNYSNKPTYGPYCGTGVKFPFYYHSARYIESNSNALHLRFRTDPGAESKGFKILYYSNKIKGGHSKCNTTLLAHDKIHYLTSHFGFPYDSTYSNKLTCSWNVKSISGKRIQIVFLYFFLTNGDYLSIFNGSKSAQSQVGRYTGWINIPTKITSNNNTLLLLFETDDFGSGNGFKIIYFQLP